MRTDGSDGGRAGASEIELATPLRDRFEIDSEIAAGGMSRLFRARDRIGGGWAAIKIVKGTSLKLRLRFDRERAILAALDHSCIVSFLADGMTIDGDPCIVMEWLEGANL